VQGGSKKKKTDERPPNKAKKGEKLCKDQGGGARKGWGVSKKRVKMVKKDKKKSPDTLLVFLDQGLWGGMGAGWGGGKKNSRTDSYNHQ